MVVLTLAAHRCPADTFTIDELGNGVGTIGSGFLADDPGPGGLSGVLTYTLPFDPAPGDVHLSEGSGFLDLIRFNPGGSLVFYSDNLDGFVSLADTPSPPTGAYPNIVSVPEFDLDVGRGALYQPTRGQPGYDGQALPTYLFISNGAVPAPAAAGGLAMLLVLTAAAKRRSGRAARPVRPGG